jgi:hypothetical protein
MFIYQKLDKYWPPAGAAFSQRQRVHSIYPSIKRLQRIIYIFCGRRMFAQRLIKEL